MGYPTFRIVKPLLHVSHEEMAGVPDFIIERWAVGNWQVKWRTSAHWSGPFKTLKEAKDSIKQNLRDA